MSHLPANLTHIALLEAESIYILREVAAQFEKPALLYSVGKDSSVLLHLAKKAFYPAPIPFTFVHVDTGFKFEEMYRFRDETMQAAGLSLIVYKNPAGDTANPHDLGTQRCCGILKTSALLQVLKENNFDAAIGGARRDEERSRAKERIFSIRDAFGQWDPRNQRPELWNLFNGMIAPGENVRAFPLSNWTEMDIWCYIAQELIPVVPLYFAQQRKIVRRGSLLLPADSSIRIRPDEVVEERMVRYRSLGCMPCSGAIESSATNIEEIIFELRAASTSERALRVIDHDSDGSMEKKKTEGYF